MKTFRFIPGTLLLAALFAPLNLQAAGYNYYFDTDTPQTDWFATNAWSSAAYPSPVYNQTWDVADPSGSNNTANIAYPTSATATRFISLGGNNVYFGTGGIIRTTTSFVGYDGLGSLEISSGTMNFNGGTINAGPTSGVAMGIKGGAVVKGDVTLTSGQLNFNGGTYENGTMTVNGGNSALTIDGATAFSGSTNLTIQLGRAEARASGMNFGDVVINGGGSGQFQIGPPNTASTVSVTVASLSGNGTLAARVNASAVSTSSFTANQATDTTFSGNIAGQSSPTGNRTSISFAKSGTGTLRLTGASIDLRVGTTVSDGTLLINGGSTRNFENQVAAATAAVTVANGGTFGGTSNLSILGGDNVVVNDGGSLAAGDGIGSAGRTTFTFSGTTTGSLDLSGATSANSWLKFDLGADTVAGTDYDQIRVADGILNIGTGLLNFDDFNFNVLAGFDVGTYTLFELTGSGALSGTLGSSLTGLVDGSLQGTLFLDGNNNILMTVVPEPSTALLGMVGLTVTLFAYRRRRRI